MKTFSFKIILICLLILPWISKTGIFAQTWGSPGSNVNLICSAPGCNYSWVFNSCSNDLTTIGANNMGVLTVQIANNTSCCDASIDAFAGDDCFGGPAPTCFGTLNMIPTLSAPTTVFACSSFNVNVKSGGSNGLNCAVTHGCPGANVSGWSVTGASCLGFCTGNVITVQVPCNSSVTSPITISANYNCNGSVPISQISVNVVLQNPTISGPQSIGCGANPNYLPSNQVTYNASNVSGAAFWVWTFPSNMSVVGSPNGQSITLNVNGTGNGNVSVQAFNANGGTVSSGVVNFPVSVCCIPVINESTLLNSGNAGYQIEAGSTINSTNDIQSTGTATMHAGVEVRMLPGFSSVLGSQIHLYPASCNSGFFRLSLPQDTLTYLGVNGVGQTSISSNEVASSTTYTMFMTGSKPKPLSSSFRNLEDNTFVISPNPTTGEISVSFSQGKRIPREIVVINGLGNVIHRANVVHEGTFTFDLSEYSNGLYLIQATINGETFSKRIIKN